MTRTLGLAGAIVLALTGVARAQPPAPPSEAVADALEVSPLRVRPGGKVSVSGEGCAPGVTVRFEVYGPHLLSSGSLTAENSGGFAALVRIPEDALPGRAWLRAGCQTAGGGGRILDATLVVIRAPFVVTWVNLLFGAGSALFVGGFGLAVRRRPRRRHKRRRSQERVARVGEAAETAKAHEADDTASSVAIQAIDTRLTRP